MKPEDMRILVVDDVTAMRKIIRSALRAGGYTDIVEAVNGTEAMGKLEGVHLVLTDIYMPGMGGFSFVRALRANPEHRHLQIIAVTAENRIAMIERMLRTGVNDYIVKPFTAVNLLSKVNGVRDRLKFNLPHQLKNEDVRNNAESEDETVAETSEGDGESNDAPSHPEAAKPE